MLAVVVLVVDRVDPRVRVVGGAEAEARDGRVGVPRLSGVHALPHPPPGAQIGAVRGGGTHLVLLPAPPTIPVSSPAPCPCPSPSPTKFSRRRMLSLDLHLWAAQNEKKQNPTSLLEPLSLLLIQAETPFSLSSLPPSLPPSPPFPCLL